MDISKPGPRRVGTGRIAGLQIIDRRVEDLKPDPNNPRHHSRKQVSQIAASIEAFGFNVPILIDREAKVIAGHGRLAAHARQGPGTAGGEL
jgi:ParB-like chromosome segregation protein Spo0J